MKIDPDVDMKTPPKVQVDTMSAARYFALAAELMKLHPPHPTDQPILARMARIKLIAGNSFDITNLAPDLQKALESAPAEAQALMKWKVATLARVNRPGEVTLHLGGRAISPATVGRLLSITDET